VNFYFFDSHRRGVAPGACSHVLLQLASNNATSPLPLFFCASGDAGRTDSGKVCDFGRGSGRKSNTTLSFLSIEWSLRGSCTTAVSTPVPSPLLVNAAAEWWYGKRWFTFFLCHIPKRAYCISFAPQSQSYRYQSCWCEIK